jgi:hypothetical protein
MADFWSILQDRQHTSYEELGAARFLPGMTPDSFCHTNILNTISAKPCLPLSAPETYDLWNFREWPDEPVTKRVQTEPPTNYLQGLEEHDPAQTDETQRTEDMRKWKREGQTWITAFMKPARRKVLKFMEQNLAANQYAAKAAAARRRAHAICSDEMAKFPKVEEVILLQSDLRPAARGKIWTWENGMAEEASYAPITSKVGFNTANIQAAAAEVGFKDLHVLQQLTETGATHGTKNFPLSCFFCRNHQGAAKHHDLVTAQIKQKIAGKHFAQQHQNIKDETADFNYATHVFATAIKGSRRTKACAPPVNNLPLQEGYSMHIPDMLPCIVVPINGTEQKLKEDEFFNMKDGRDYKLNVRGTYDGSSPHADDGEPGLSPNDFCDLPPELNKRWYTSRHVARSIKILSSIGEPISKWLVDLDKAYTQVWVQGNLTYRQFVYWKWEEAGNPQASTPTRTSTRGGFYRDKRAQWGGKYISSLFHRAITTLFVKYATKQLVENWAPRITSQKAKLWMRKRTAAGLAPHQCIPAVIGGFLDDFFPVVCGNAADIALAHGIVMKAFEYFGFTLSASKLAAAGTPSPTGTILGHGVDLKQLIFFITKHKQARIRDIFEPMLQALKWNREALQSGIGLLQSVVDDTDARWRLLPLYQVLHALGIGNRKTTVIPSATARRCLQFVMATLDAHAPILRQPTMWPQPSDTLIQMMPIVDAASTLGYGGCLLVSNQVFFFGGMWPDFVRNTTDIPIFVLEAIAVLMGMFTWAKWLRSKKFIFRSDSSNVCFTFNKLASKHPAMRLLADVWSDSLAELQAESILTHCKGDANVWGDIPSRWPVAEAKVMLREELRKISMENADLKYNDVVWKIPGIGTAIPDLHDIAAICIAHKKHTAREAEMSDANMPEGIACMGTWEDGTAHHFA